jgi:hypothetical protein
MMLRFDRISVAIYMTRPELTTLADPENFRPFVIVTAGGTRYSIDHPDYIDIPPVPQPEAGEEVGASYVTVYMSTSLRRSEKNSAIFLGAPARDYG